MHMHTRLCFKMHSSKFIFRLHIIVIAEMMQKLEAVANQCQSLSRKNRRLKALTQTLVLDVLPAIPHHNLDLDVGLRVRVRLRLKMSRTCYRHFSMKIPYPWLLTRRSWRQSKRACRNWNVFRPRLWPRYWFAFYFKYFFAYDRASGHDVIIYCFTNNLDFIPISRLKPIPHCHHQYQDLVSANKAAEQQRRDDAIDAEVTDTHMQIYACMHPWQYHNHPSLINQSTTSVYICIWQLYNWWMLSSIQS